MLYLYRNVFQICQGKRIGAVIGSTAYYSLISYYKELGAEIITDTVTSYLKTVFFLLVVVT